MLQMLLSTIITSLKRLGLLLISLFVLSACTTVGENVSGTTLPQQELIQLTLQAQHAFNREPRSLNSVLQAYELMTEAAGGSRRSDSSSYQRMILASRYANWLSYYSTDSQDKIRYAKQAVAFSNTAVILNGREAAGYYYRAMATGLYAQQQPLQSMDAMQKIQQDAFTAVKLDETYDMGGPHRILGGLYLRAPGPPTGVGSLQRALKHLRISYSLGKDQPDNNLLLAEALIRVDNEAEAKALLTPLLAKRKARSSHHLEQRDRYQRARELLK